MLLYSLKLPELRQCFLVHAIVINGNSFHAEL